MPSDQPITSARNAAAPAVGTGLESSPTLADTVYDALLRGIVEGAHPLNARLPAEAELARTHGVSRPVVRAALARLREDGIVASRRGSGSYVVRRPSRMVQNFVPLGSIGDIQRCYDFRADVEAAAAAWAARLRDDDDLRAIEAAAAKFETELAAGALGVEVDIEFHLAVARASKNPFFAGVQESLGEQISFAMALSRNMSLLLPGDRQRVLAGEHRAVLDAIARRDPEAAAAAMRTHVEAARERIFDGDEG